MFWDKFMEKRDGTIRFYDLHSTKTKILAIVILVLCFLIVLVSIFPPIWVMLAGFKELPELRTEPKLLPNAFQLIKYKEEWTNLNFAKFYLNSLWIVVGTVIAAVFFNGLLAYGLAIIKPSGYKVVLALVMWSLLIPPTVSIVALFRNINMFSVTLPLIGTVGLAETRTVLWLAFGANAFYVVLFKQFFEEMPMEILEAARIDGCGRFQIFMRIVMPLSKSIAMVVIIYAINAAWSDFLLPYLVLDGTGKETVMITLFKYRTAVHVNDLNIIRAVVFSIIPPIILFAIFQKQITEGAAAGAVKG